MFRRKVYDYMLKWKNEKNHKPLIIKGLRQIGKSTIVEKFANENYKSVIMLDFRKNVSLHDVFEGDFNIDDIMFQITAKMKKVKLIPNETVIIMDEIQDCPNARSSLKYFCLDGRYDVICTGSLLGIKGFRKSKKKTRGIPVGFEEQYEMKPMDFEEFLWANDINETVIEKMKECLNERKQIPEFIHNMMTDLFKKYICIGGMPEVVLKYVETKDYNKAREIQKRIISDYESDFGTHLNDDLDIDIDIFAKTRISDTFHSIPKQLSKDNKKFQYSVISKNAKGREYKDSIDWLEDYGLVNRCYNLSALEMPFDSFAQIDNFKIYMADTGLYVAMLDDDAPSHIIDGDYNIGKGAIYGNIAADMFSKINKKMYFFQKSSGLEIDFITSLNKKVCLVEVKATNGNTKSSKSILDNYDKYKVEQLVKISSQNIRYLNNKLNIPHYLAFLVFAVK